MEVEEVGYFQGPYHRTADHFKDRLFEMDFLEVFNYNLSVLADVSSVCMHVCMYVMTAWKCMYVQTASISRTCKLYDTIIYVACVYLYVCMYEFTVTT